jgi:hypothetical protein
MWIPFESVNNWEHHRWSPKCLHQRWASDFSSNWASNIESVNAVLLLCFCHWEFGTIYYVLADSKTLLATSCYSYHVEIFFRSYFFLTLTISHIQKIMQISSTLFAICFTIVDILSLIYFLYICNKFLNTTNS